MTAPVSVMAPASKSMSHRAVIAAALARGKSLLHNVLVSDDLKRTMDCLRACGAGFNEQKKYLEVTGVGCRPRGGESSPADLNVHESGTTCRLMTAVAAAGRGLFRIHGAPRMHERPIAALAEALAVLGVTFSWESSSGYPPFVLSTSGLEGGATTIDMAESSQYLSGLLLAAPCARDGLTIKVGGDKIVSWPYVALTLQTMEDSGISFTVQTLVDGTWITTPWREIDAAIPGRIRFRIRPGEYAAGSRTVEGDWSNASYFLAAGAMGGRPVRVTGLRKDSLQGDRAMVDILAGMGAGIRWDRDGVEVSAQDPGRLKGIEVDMGSCPDIVPTVAVVAAFAGSPSRIRGAAHLRIKECDRLEATAAELRKTGAAIKVLEDGLYIEPTAETGREVNITTYGDHRMAMSMSLLELRGWPVTFDNPKCVEKSFPGFWDAWKGLKKQLADRSS